MICRRCSFYYQQGCFIGCPECDHVSGRRQIDLCGLGKKATINDPKYRSVNRNATAGSIYDIYKHNPWRAPGSAPTADACGLAGGTPFLQEGTEAGDYSTTKFAHHGTYGTTLPPMDTGVKWKIGGTAEVTWQVLNNRKHHHSITVHFYTATFISLLEKWTMTTGRSLPSTHPRSRSTLSVLLPKCLALPDGVCC